MYSEEVRNETITSIPVLEPRPSLVAGLAWWDVCVYSHFLKLVRIRLGVEVNEKSVFMPLLLQILAYPSIFSHFLSQCPTLTTYTSEQACIVVFQMTFGWVFNGVVAFLT